MNSYNQSFPTAIAPQKSRLTILNNTLVEQAIEYSNLSPRKRIIFPFHKKETDLLHRMLNAVQPNSYIRPHCHDNPPKPESIVVLRGEIKLITFHQDGTVENKYVLTSNSEMFGIDIEPDIIHTFVALKKNTVLYEVKPGPYEAENDKNFAPWAPEEEAKEVSNYLAYLYNA